MKGLGTGVRGFLSSRLQHHCIAILGANRKGQDIERYYPSEDVPKPAIALSTCAANFLIPIRR